MTRMIKGEERNEEIWNHLKNLFSNLFKENISPENLKDLEIKSIAAILKILGYLEETSVSGNGLISAINRAIKESML